jgi:Fur family ferric uptake transcriptional regulator
MDDVARYAVNRGEERHPHFHCRVCGAITCMKDIRLPRVDVPDNGFVVEEEHLTLRGVCPECSECVEQEEKGS